MISLQKEMEMYLLGLIPIPERTEEEKYRSEFKFAIVKNGKKQKIVYQHKETGEQCYFFKDDKYTDLKNDKELRMIEKPYKFIRWARLMDL